MNSLKTFMNKVGERVREVAPQGSPIIEGTNPKDTEMEGFVCPSCFTHFTTPEILEKHYSETHLDPSANYLCPVCRARLNSQSELEIHYSSIHGDRDFNNHSLEALREELMELSTNLREERWYSEELKKEVERLQEAFKKKGTEDSESDIYVHKNQLDAVEESKTMLSSEVVLLRKQLTEALEKCSFLRGEKETLEQRASDFAVERAELRATLDSLQAEKVGIESLLHDKTCNFATLESNNKEEMERLHSEIVKLTESFAIKSKECQSQKEREAALQQDLKLKSEISAELKDEMRNLKMDFDLMKKQLQEKCDEACALQLQIKEQDTQLSATIPQDVLLELPVKTNCTEDVLVKSEEPNENIVHSEMRLKIEEIEQLNAQLKESVKSKLRAEELAREKLKRIDELEDNLSDMQRSLKDKSSDFDKLQITLQESNQTIELLNSKVEEIFSLKREIEQERELNVSTKKELNFQNVTISNLEKDIENYISQIEDINNCKVKSEIEFKEKQVSLSNALSTIESMKIEIDNYEQIIKEKNKSVEDLENSVKKLFAKEQSLNVMLSTNMSEIQSLKSSQESLLTEKLNLEKELVVRNRWISSEKESKINVETQINLKNQIVQLKDDIKSKEDELTCSTIDFENKITDLELRRCSLKEENEDIQRRIKELEELKKVLLSNEQKLIKESVTMKNLIQAKENYEMNLTKELSNLKKEKVELQENNGFITKEIERLQLEMKKIGDQSKNEQRRIVELEGKFATQEAEMAGLLGDKLELEVKVEAATEEQKSLVERCVAAESEVERLQQQLTQLRRKLDDSTAALHELGRENQSLQMETAKLSERKWAEDSEVPSCSMCMKNFSMTVRRHHCRNCLQIFCNDCSSKQAPVEQNRNSVRVCDSCYAEISSKL